MASPQHAFNTTRTTMTTPGSTGHEGTGGHVIRFSGHDPSEYGEWKVWAQNRLRKLRLAGKPPEALGSELLDLLVPGTPAFKAVKKLTSVEIESADGADKIWAKLNSRFPEEEKEDEVNEAMAAVKSMKPERGEQMPVYLKRVDPISTTR